MTRTMPIAPASRVWVRNSSPKVAEICSLETSAIGNGSEPNLRTVTSSLASLAGKPPRPPPVIWPVPPAIGELIDGALMTRSSRVIAKSSPTWFVVYSANSSAPASGCRP